MPFSKFGSGLNRKIYTNLNEGPVVVLRWAAFVPSHPKSLSTFPIPSFFRIESVGRPVTSRWGLILSLFFIIYSKCNINFSQEYVSLDSIYECVEIV